jgi:hypothetical protein
MIAKPMMMPTTSELRGAVDGVARVEAEGRESQGRADRQQHGCGEDRQEPDHVGHRQARPDA